jgi:hypothetical protein
VKGIKIQPCQVFLFILESDILHAVKSYDMEPIALLWIFIALKKMYHLGGV